MTVWGVKIEVFELIWLLIYSGLLGRFWKKVERGRKDLTFEEKFCIFAD